MEAVAIDFHRVAERHESIHARLENWARWCAARRPMWMAPIWRMGKPLGRQWNAPEPRVLVDASDGHAMELAVRNLPELHREAIRWCYVYRVPPARMARQLGVSYEWLLRLVADGRNMLMNRLA
jgi:DNA-directed RNA polymerase specialized sigma24 family protein